MPNQQRLKQLLNLVKMIDEAKLGNDWESRKELEKIRVVAVEEIKSIQQQLKHNDVVK